MASNFCAPHNYKKTTIFLGMLIKQRDFMVNHSPRWIACDCLLRREEEEKGKRTMFMAFLVAKGDFC